MNVQTLPILLGIHQSKQNVVYLCSWTSFFQFFLSRFKAEKVTKPWAKYNSYWDEKTIDVQWHQYVKKRKIESFKK